MSADTVPSGEPPQEISEDEYFALEQKSPTKHEWRRGRVVAMGGASPVHNFIQVNLLHAFVDALRGRRCTILPSDQRVHIADEAMYTYPDIAVTCDRPRFTGKDGYSLENPRVVVEILSKSTEAYDRGKKFERYKALPSLAEYVLVEQDEHRIDHLRRLESGQWLLTTYKGDEDVLVLPALDCRIPLSAIYANLDLLEEVSASPAPPSATLRP